MASAVQLQPKKTSRRASTRQVRSQFHRLRIVLNKRIACTPMAVVLTEHGVSLSGSELGGVNRQSLVAVCAPLQAVIGAGCTHNYSAVSASRYRHSGVRLINLSPTIGWPLSLSLSPSFTWPPNAGHLKGTECAGAFRESRGPLAGEPDVKNGAYTRQRQLQAEIGMAGSMGVRAPAHVVSARCC